MQLLSLTVTSDRPRKGLSPSITKPCPTHSDITVEYSLRDVNKPIGVSEYQITENLPEQLKSSLPTIEQIEAELGGFDDV
jgi:hypothetical protein